MSVLNSKGVEKIMNCSQYRHNFNENVMEEKKTNFLKANNKNKHILRIYHSPRITNFAQAHLKKWQSISPGPPALNMSVYLLNPFLAIFLHLPRPGFNLLINILLNWNWNSWKQCRKPLQFCEKGAKHLSNGHYTASTSFHI